MACSQLRNWVALLIFVLESIPFSTFYVLDSDYPNNIPAILDGTGQAPNEKIYVYM